MRDPSEWTETDLQQMIDNKIQENLYLDYKRSDALGKMDGDYTFNNSCSLRTQDVGLAGRLQK